MTSADGNLNILSGGAAQGLVKSLAPAFKAKTGLDIEGEFGAVGAMADKLRAGRPTDIIILTEALVGTLAQEKLAAPASVRNVGVVETALAVRSSDPKVSAPDQDSLRKALLAADAIYVPDTRASTAGIHVAKVLALLGIAQEVESRLKIYPNGATAMRHSGRVSGNEADRLHAIDGDHQYIRRDAVRSAAAGLRTRHHVHGGRHDRRRPDAGSAGPDRPSDCGRPSRTSRPRRFSRAGVLG